MMTLSEFKNCNRIHFIGIGGIGISAIARMLLLEGKKVSGTDRSKSLVTDELEQAGADIFIDQTKSHIPPHCDVVIYTVAIPSDNIEIQEAHSKAIPLLTYPETLKLISEEKYTIAISGTHGKTTTTAMVAKILIDAKIDPTVIIGCLLKNPDGSKSNFVAGKSDYLIVEADEYKKAFLNLNPRILVITNIDEDHLDFYKDLSDIQQTFTELVKKIPTNGFLICNTRDPHLFPVISEARCSVIDYKETTLTVSLKVPGEHNRDDAKAALSVAKVIGISEEVANSALSHYEGVWRRFELKGKAASGTLIYDDYAHNPQKIKAALAGAREMYPDKRIIAVFQPHLYSRTKLLLSEFAQSFNNADIVLIAPIFPAREEFDPSINSMMLAEALQKNNVNAQAFDDFEAIVKVVSALNLSKNDLLLTIGAGDAYKVGEAFIS